MKIMRLADVPLTSELINDNDNVIVGFTNSDDAGEISFGNLVDDIALDIVNYIYGE